MIYLIYDVAEREFAQQVQQNVSSVVDCLDLRGEAGWNSQVDYAIRDSHTCILIATPAVSQSPIITYEWALALAWNTALVILLRQPTDLHPRLAMLPVYDFIDQAPWDDLKQMVNDIETEALLAADNSVLNMTTPLSKGGVDLRIAQLEQDLNNANPKVRQAAITLLGQFRKVETLETLLSALDDDDSRVREAAIDAIGMLGVPDGTPRLLVILASETDSYLRRASAQALGKIGSPASVPALIVALADGDGDVQRAAATALDRIGTPEAKAAAKRWRNR